MKESKLRVQYLGRIRYIVGKDSEDITIPDDLTVRELINLLSERYGETFKNHILNAQRQLHSSMVILLDGVNITHTAGLNTKIGKCSEAKLAFMSAVGGGAPSPTNLTIS